MQYHHTQRAPVHLMLHFFAAFCFYYAWMLRGETVLLVSILAAGLAFALLGLAFRELTVSDDGDALGVRFGPLPLFSARIPYQTIVSVETGRSSPIDGWGVHYLPGRGWTYNLWGFDCVNVKYDGRFLRIGSDDSENLVKFLRGRCALLAGDASEDATGGAD